MQPSPPPAYGIDRMGQPSAPTPRAKREADHASQAEHGGRFGDGRGGGVEDRLNGQRVVRERKHETLSDRHPKLLNDTPLKVAVLPSPEIWVTPAGMPMKPLPKARKGVVTETELGATKIPDPVKPPVAGTL